MAELTVRLIDAGQSRELRRAALRPHLEPGIALSGDDLPGALHLAAFDGSSLVSACMILPQPCEWQRGRPAWRLRSMATEPTVRRTGAGAAVVRAAAEVARDRGAELLWCPARQPAIGFYQRCGWQLHGQPFTTEYGPHRYMWLDLVGN